MSEYQLEPIGTVVSPLTTLRDCPKQYSENAPEADVIIRTEFADALTSLKPGMDVLLFTWLHQADRSIQRVHPRGNLAVPKKGVFGTRSPDRPNPIGLHHVRILDIEGQRLHVDRLEVLNGTPIVDIKSISSETSGAKYWGGNISSSIGQELENVCRAGWEKNLLNGFNGNVSMRIGKSIVITRSGAAKGFLSPGDLTTIDLESGTVTGPGTAASSEAPVHLAVYRQQPEAKAVVHTHPTDLLAYSLKHGTHFDLPLFEADFYTKMLSSVPPMQPGTEELGLAVGEKAKDYRAILMEHHGLVCWGDTPISALALNEELNSLARLALLAGK